MIHRVIWVPPEEGWIDYATFMLRPYAEELPPSKCAIRPGGVRMVHVAVAGMNWTRRAEIVQEASKVRSAAKSDDAITQAVMNDRLQALGSQMGARHHARELI